MKLERIVQQWKSTFPPASPNDPLRMVSWWKARLMETLPTDALPTGIHKDEFILGGTKYPLVISVPSKYRGKVAEAPYPLILTVLEKEADPKKTLQAAYGALLETHFVVASYEDRLRNEGRFQPGLVLPALLCAHFRYRIDRDRVVLDGLGKGARFVDEAAASPEMALQFNGAVLRNPATVSPFLKNLGLFPTAVIAPEPAPAPVAAFVAAVGAVDPAQPKVLPPGDEEAVQAWIANLPPRRVSDQKQPFSFWMRSTGRTHWAFWIHVSRAYDAGPDKPIHVAIRNRDPEHNLVDLVCRNVSDAVLYLNDEILDLDQPITVRVNGVVVARKRADGGRGLLPIFDATEGLATNLRGPRNYFITGRLPFHVGEEAQVTEEEKKARADQEKAVTEALRRADEERKRKEEEERKAAQQPPAPANGAGPAPAPAEPVWLPDWAAAVEAAKRDGKPICAVFSGAVDAPGQSVLDGALATPEVSQRLVRFACVRLTVEGDAGKAEKERLERIAPGTAAPAAVALGADETPIAAFPGADLREVPAATEALVRFLDAALPAPAPAAEPVWLSDWAVTVATAKKDGRAVFALFASSGESAAQAAMDAALKSTGVKERLLRFACVRLVVEGEAGNSEKERLGKMAPGTTAPVAVAVRSDESLIAVFPGADLKEEPVVVEALVRFLDASDPPPPTKTPEERKPGEANPAGGEKKEEPPPGPKL